MSWFWKRKKKANKKASTSQDISKIARAEVQIKVFRDFGSNVSQLVGSFKATEVRDGYGGLVFSNKDQDFAEDVDFQKDDLYREMKVLLKIRNLSKDKQLKSIEIRILRQRKILHYLDTNVELNGTFNYIDEKLKLRDYNILHSHVKNIDETMGSFFTIENGIRVYSFVSKDGFLYPVWNGVDHYTTYPDYTRKHKIKNIETEIFRKEWEERFKDKVSVASVIAVLIILVGLVGANMFWMMKNYQATEKMAEKTQGASIKCMNTATLLTSDIMKVLQVECVQKAIDINNLFPELIKNETVTSLN